MNAKALSDHKSRRKAREAALSAERVRSLFNYDPETGSLSNAVPRGAQGRYPTGYVQGSDQSSADHIRVNVDGRIFLAHRLIWLIVYGRWPEDQLDHRDKNKRNNRLSNLREATDGTNRQNMPIQSNNSSGHPGVSQRGNGWRAYITVQRTQICLGQFDSLDAAIAARRTAEVEHHPFKDGGSPWPISTQVAGQ